MHVLITGGAGFIGTNLRKTLESHDYVSKVTLLDDLSSGLESNIADMTDKSIFVEGSILNQSILNELIDMADCVVHLAARPSVARSVEDPDATSRVNVTGTLNILEAIRQKPKTTHLIFASSSSVYGTSKKLPKSEYDACSPISPYAASKLTGEVYALAYQRTYGIPVTAFRFFNVYGPFQQPNHAYAAVVPAFIYAALHDIPIPIHGDGLQTRDFTYVGTLADVISESIRETVTNDGPINLAFGTQSTLLDLIEEMSNLFNRSFSVEHLPARLGDVRDSQADNSILRALFPSIMPTPLESGLLETKTWMEVLHS